ncbi:uncharacterized protein ACR2FA_000758 [Aphomia sociella]
MKAKHLCLLLVAVIASATVVAAQSEIELSIPVENDNQFPPDNQPDDGDAIQGSGNGAIAEPEDPAISTTESKPPIEEVQSRTLLVDVEPLNEENKGCPEKCMCHFEGEHFVTDCSGLELSEFPSTININTTILKIQNNRLTEIPKTISSLKNVKFLNASNNLIMELASGSISELPELVKLDLSNNRLLEYPKDLKNGFGLTKLEELALGGNDMREALDTDAMSKFTSLQKLTIPSGLLNPQLEETLCKSLQKVLIIICTDTTCEPSTSDCSSDNIENDVEPENDLDAVLPGTIYKDDNDEDNSDPSVPNENVEPDNKEALQENEKINKETTSENEGKAVSSANTSSTSEFSLRSAVIKGPIGVSPQSSIVEMSNDLSSEKEATNPNISATTDKNGGGVNKSAVGLIVAGMVVVIAGITIKKNWSSIKKRFSSNSNSRTPNERPISNANGTTPEEVPLQDKSPV